MNDQFKSRAATPAERQRDCRARKRGELVGIRSEEEKRALGLPSIYDAPALPSPPAPAAALPAPKKPGLPAPKSGTAIQKSLSLGATSLALTDANAAGDELHLSLPPAVAARLRSLLDRHESGKPLTAAERAEAQGLIDIAEYFIVQRLRNRLAA